MTIKNITVLGSGIMGHGIAQVSAMAGYNVVLRDIEKQFLDKAMEKIKWSLDKL
ncbi:MAG: 3-hydroxyacyl-CoA dehydrogenase NAD-binding domain-containing protein, partial [Nitrosotalea sp.]